MSVICCIDWIGREQKDFAGSIRADQGKCGYRGTGKVANRWGWESGSAEKVSG
jgi:hypothetical protein